MTDLLRVLPNFPVGQYASLVAVLDKHGVTTADLLTLEIADIGKRTQLPLLDVKRFCDAVIKGLHDDLGVSKARASASDGASRTLKSTLADLNLRTACISVLDDELDHALGGGIPASYITEITGESGAGKTQFLLTLLLTAQLPAPRGLGRGAIYVSTEAPLSTQRLSQILSQNPYLSALPSEDRPSLDYIVSTVTSDLESQEHVLQFQVPVMVERNNIGLLIIDSVAANYRAEFERAAGGGSGSKSRGSNMAARSHELIRLGALLRGLAQKYNLAVVVANQVADRFNSPSGPIMSSRPGPGPGPGTPSLGAVLLQESPLATRSQAPPAGVLEGLEPPSSMAEYFKSSMPPPPEPPRFDDGGPPTIPALALDHQQRWFTGWGDDPYADYSLKTPSLGVVWSTQLASRIVLFKKPVYGVHRHVDDESDEAGMPSLKNWRRWMKVVFAPHAQGTGQGLDGAVEFEMTMGGLKAVETGGRKKALKERAG